MWNFDVSVWVFQQKAWFGCNSFICVCFCFGFNAFATLFRWSNVSCQWLVFLTGNITLPAQNDFVYRNFITELKRPTHECIVHFILVYTWQSIFFSKTWIVKFLVNDCITLPVQIASCMCSSHYALRDRVQVFHFLSHNS